VIIHFAIDPKKLLEKNRTDKKIITRDKKKSTARKVSSFFPIFFKLIPWSYSLFNLFLAFFYIFLSLFLKLTIFKKSKKY